MTTICILCASALLTALSPASPLQGKASSKVDVVAVTGCLREPSAGTWMLEQASDPVVSTANAPPPKEMTALPKSGKNQFQLTGVTVFDLASHRGHSVLIKGLLNKATPVSRLNMTSLTMVSPDCPAK